MDCEELESFVYPYLDNEFGDSEKWEVEQHLSRCAACARRVQDEREFLQNIRQAVRRPLSRAPSHLQERVATGLQQEQRHAALQRWSRLGVAATAVLALGTATYWVSRPWARQRYVEDAAVHHGRQFPLEVQHLAPAQIEAWFGGKLNHPVRVPQLRKAIPTGGRLLNVQEKQAAYIRYDAELGTTSNNGQVGLFVFDDHGRDVALSDTPESGSSHGFNVVSWREGDVVYQLVSDLSESDLRQMLPLSPAPWVHSPGNGAGVPIQPAHYQR